MHTSVLKIPLIIVLLAFQLPGMAQKTDKVFLKNGDVVTGEIKSLKLAKLSFDMKGPGVISIKWEEIVRITSDKIFQVSMQNGSVLITKLDTFFFKKEDVSLNEIVEIVQIKNKFFKRLEGDINIGFNYTKSSDILQFNLNTSILYRKPKMETNLKLNNLITKSSNDTITSKKQDATLSGLKRLKQRHYLMGNLGWEENTQLGLVNRILVSGVAGKIFVNDNQQRLLSGAGLSYNQEEFSDTSGFKKNLEGVVMVQFKKFRYSSPKINIDAEYMIFPGLSDWGRVRMNLQLNTSIEVLKDCMVGFTFYDNFDNRPSSTAASKNDYGITFTIGYKFGK